MIRFGSWSAVLGLASGFGVLVATRLASISINRAALRFLAALLIVAALRLMPYVLGFAGFYDVYPWLSFAPFDLSLATGPLLYLYVHTLIRAEPPRRWRPHLAPAVLQLGYSAWAFSLPLARKNAWDHRVHEPLVDPIETLAALISLGVYLAASTRILMQYEHWLKDHRSDGGDHRQPWLRGVLAALGLWLLVSAVFDGFSYFIVTLNYYDRFAEYLAFSAIILGLGLEGWRYADRAFPIMGAETQYKSSDEIAIETTRDWRQMGETWSQTIGSQGWWREPAIALGQIARRLGTNEAYLSRALNEGLGSNFNAVINRFRVEAVQRQLMAGDQRDFLTLALEAGFGSKASFNRAFKEAVGMSPSAWRAAHIRKIAAVSVI